MHELGDATTVTAHLPGGGGVVRLQLADVGGGSGGSPVADGVSSGDRTLGNDGIGSVGLKEKLDLQDAMASLGQMASLVREKVDMSKPAKASVEFQVGFTVEAGKLTCLLGNDKADASMKVCLEWSKT